MPHRIQKLISNYGHCSRRRAEELIKEGRVKVNGKVASIGDSATEMDAIEIEGQKIRKPRPVYLMVNKPTGCVTALRDPQYKTVMDYIRVKERVFPIGRLDYNTSGLLLLTNDGDFANKVMHPRNEIKKTYLVEFRPAIHQAQVRELQKGIDLEEGTTYPARVRLFSPTLLEVTIHEGKNRIVRRMLETLGLKVRSLHRMRVGKLELGSLKLGKFKYLHSTDIQKIFR